MKVDTGYISTLCIHIPVYFLYHTGMWTIYQYCTYNKCALLAEIITRLAKSFNSEQAQYGENMYDQYRC